MKSPDNRIIKASFRECPISDRECFKRSHCLVPISVGQSIHEAKKFLATIKLINASFQKCTILIDDTVQRHTIKIDHPNCSAHKLYQMALLEGDLWLERNKSAIQMLSIPYEIMRWDQWFEHPRFAESLSKVENLYSTDLNYQKAINFNIEDYLGRYMKRNNSQAFDLEHAFACCLSYLKEECGVMTLWAEGGYDFEVYPSGRNKAMAATYEYLIKPRYPELLRPVALRFKKYPSPLTVSFESTNLMSSVLHQPMLNYENITA